MDEVYFDRFDAQVCNSMRDEKCDSFTGESFHVEY